MYVGLLRGDEIAYRDKVQHLATCFADSSLAINVQKPGEIFVNSRRASSYAHVPIYINGAVMEHVSIFKFLDVHISDSLTWSLNASILIKKACRRRYILWSLKRAHLGEGGKVAQAD